VLTGLTSHSCGLAESLNTREAGRRGDPCSLRQPLKTAGLNPELVGQLDSAVFDGSTETNMGLVAPRSEMERWESRRDNP
jgi:hypothetical protein